MSDPGAPAPIPATTLTQTHFSWLRTRLSVERTFMSWTRTATALIGFGFTIYQFLPKLSPAANRPDAARNFGLAFIATGVLAMLVGIGQRRAEVRYLSGPEYAEWGWREGLPQWRWAYLIGLVVALVGLVTFGWVLVGG